VGSLRQIICLWNIQPYTEQQLGSAIEKYKDLRVFVQHEMTSYNIKGDKNFFSILTTVSVTAGSYQYTHKIIPQNSWKIRDTNLHTYFFFTEVTRICFCTFQLQVNGWEILCIRTIKIL